MSNTTRTCRDANGKWLTHLPNKPGVYYGLPFADYVKIDAVNASSLKHLLDSPAHYKAALKDSRLRDRDTDALRIGRAIHSFVLERDTFFDSVWVWSGADRRLKKNKDAFEALEETNKGRTRVDQSDIDSFEEVDRAIKSHPAASDLFSKGQPEVTFLWIDEPTGMLCKMRADWLDTERKRLVDLKTARTTDHRRFCSQGASLGYHISMAHYRAGIEAVTGQPYEVFLVAAEKSVPFDVGVFHMSALPPHGPLFVGEKQRRELLTQLSDLRTLDLWPGRSGEIQEFVLPVWSLPEDDIYEADDIT